MQDNFLAVALIVLVSVAATDAAATGDGDAVADRRAAEPDFTGVPGVVVDHSPKSSGRYVGSPAIAILPDGRHVASHDLFGPKSTEHVQAVTRVFRSADRGQTWTHLTDIHGAFWSSLFVHGGALYLLGTYHHYGDAVIRRSSDGGKTWTEPKDSGTGLLLKGNYHCAPVPVTVHGGRIWRAMEDRMGPGGWGTHFRSLMMSAPVDSNLLHADSWTLSSRLGRDPKWLQGAFRGWLEGNAVVDPAGRLVNILRVACQQGGKAAIVRISDDGRNAAFDPTDGFIDFPGGAKKFTIRFDSRTERYWSLSNWVPPRHAHEAAGGTRNTLALVSSANLRRWTINCLLLHHPDRARHGFQYPDWLFDGDDIVAAIRTAYDDGLGGAHNAHDANFLTFHRFANFRNLTLADGATHPDELTAPPRIVIDAPEFTVVGRHFAEAKLADEARAYGNRKYVWKDLPERFVGWRFTRTNGGERAEVTVSAQRDTVVYVATASSQRGIDMTGWKKLERLSFFYTDKGRSRMQVFSRSLRAGQKLEVPQGNWSGAVVLIPPPSAPAIR